MNKYRGSNFKDYIKEKGIPEEISARAKKRWKALHAEASVVPEDTTQSPGDPPQQHNGFFQGRMGNKISVMYMYERTHGTCENRNPIN